MTLTVKDGSQPFLLFSNENSKILMDDSIQVNDTEILFKREFKCYCKQNSIFKTLFFE